ncbi:shikimate dehydrogenase family protein [Haploplasma axanthum]|uniref:Shikimate dehydrogenase n=1 Tax=Haploplasma axanthum TaxID=29552 RepID=A0A449BDG9_HAPAX|nr:hypothetical protein [Haploplasma axanthum]VEU80350.1 Shikimate dehydrogenase [Haploplasma axanthum]
MNNYGLLGNNISYSKSSELHRVIAKYFGFEVNYELIDIKEESLEKYLKNKFYQGFNVTKPYKETIIKYLDELSLISKKTGAVNTIYYKNNKLYGDNTDYYGFKYLISYYNIDIKNKRIAILGTGGAAKVIHYYLKKYTSDVYYISRTRKDNLTISYAEFPKYDFDIIINATPIGTFPNINESPISSEYVNNKIIIDLTYNPRETKLMSYTKDSYNGLIMLIVQALYASKKWGNEVKINKRIVNEIKELIENV